MCECLRETEYIVKFSARLNSSYVVDELNPLLRTSIESGSIERLDLSGDVTLSL